MTVQIKININESLMDAAIDVSKQERENPRKKASGIKLKNILCRMIRDGEGFSEDEIPRKKSRQRKDTRDGNISTI